MKERRSIIFISRDYGDRYLSISQYPAIFLAVDARLPREELRHCE
jgi:hypothetical protein